MSFWEKALGTPAPAAPVAPQAQPAQQPWFRPNLPTPLQQAPVTPVPQPPVEQQPQTRARSARMTETCPDCGSGNYFRPEGSPNAMAQCYHCGYNPRFSHSTAGMRGTTSDTGPATPARQVSVGNNYNPGTIVASIK